MNIPKYKKKPQSILKVLAQILAIMFPIKPYSVLTKQCLQNSYNPIAHVGEERLKIA